MSQDFGGKVQKVITTVPVKKPSRDMFFRVREEEDWRLNTPVLKLREEGQTYLVDRAVWPELPGELVPKVLFTAVSRRGDVFLWPIRLPGEDGRHDDWNRSALDAARRAMSQWIRIAANRSLGAYDVFQAAAELPEPEWPDDGFEYLLKVAFRDRYITSADHPVVRRLRGEQ